MCHYSCQQCCAKGRKNTHNLPTHLHTVDYPFLMLNVKKGSFEYKLKNIIKVSWSDSARKLEPRSTNHAADALYVKIIGIKLECSENSTRYLSLGDGRGRPTTMSEATGCKILQRLPCGYLRDLTHSDCPI